MKNKLNIYAKLYQWELGLLLGLLLCHGLRSDIYLLFAFFCNKQALLILGKKGLFFFFLILFSFWKNLNKYK